MGDAEKERDTKERYLPFTDSPFLRVVIVSGLSGSGKTVALRAIEDTGYFCIDNLPIKLIKPFLSTIAANDIKNIGIGIDIREKEFLEDAYSILSDIKRDCNIEILFLEAEKDVIIRRYKETRRPHPMLTMRGSPTKNLGGRDMDIEKAMEEERSLLSAIREASDRVIDTSGYTPHQLRHLIMSYYGNANKSHAVKVSIMSFGYKFGTPLNVDLLFDVRFLPNPYFISELKPLKGIDNAVRSFVLENDKTKEFLSHLLPLIDFLLPQYTAEGKTYLTIAVGCTGGVHRSPAIADEIAVYIRQRHGLETDVIHRDME